MAATTPEIQPQYDPAFEACKREEDYIRQVLADERFNVSHAYAGLVKLDKGQQVEVLKKALQARFDNINNSDIQLRSINNQKGVNIYGNVSSDGHLITDDRPQTTPRASLDLPPIFERQPRDGVGTISYTSTLDAVCLIPAFYRDLPAELAEHLVLAGGSVVNALLDICDKDVDYDLFIVGAKDPKQVVVDFLEHIKGQIAIAFRSVNAITLRLKTKEMVQIILGHSRTPSELLMRFDLDASGCCYHKGEFYVTPRALYSLRTMTLNVDVEKRGSYNYESRLYKYLKYKGFSIRIPVPITMELLGETLKNQHKLRRNSYHTGGPSLMRLLALQMFGGDSSDEGDYAPLGHLQYADLERSLRFMPAGSITYYTAEPYNVVLGYAYKYDSTQELSHIWDISYRKDVSSDISAYDGVPVKMSICPMPSRGSFRPVETSWGKWARESLKE